MIFRRLGLNFEGTNTLRRRVQTTLNAKVTQARIAIVTHKAV